MRRIPAVQAAVHRRLRRALPPRHPLLPQSLSCASGRCKFSSCPYFDGANLLVAADCTAYAYADFHRDFIRNRIALVGCPKLDPVDYSEKLTEILRRNDIKSVTIVRMEVPCCGGLEHAAREALRASGKFLPWQVVTISIDGKILDR